MEDRADLMEVLDMDHRTTATASAVIGHPAAEDAVPPKPVPKIPRIDVNAILFRAANECVSDEDTRYYLQGVYVQPHPDKGVLLTATDGHRLVCIHDESGSCDKAAIIIVEDRAFAGVKIDKKKPDEIPRLKLDADGHVVVGTYRGVESAIIDGTYPDYPRVLTPIVAALKKGAYVPASYKHEYLVSFGRIVSLITSGSHAIRLISTGEADASLILFEGAAHAFGILMPMRTNCQNGMPAFMRPVLEPPKPPAAPPAEAAPAPKAKVRAKPKKKPAAKPKKSRRAKARK
jgi:hypothetical protein